MCVEVYIEELSNQRHELQWLSLYCLSVLNFSFIAGSTKMDLGPLDILPFPASWVWSIFFRGHRRDILGGKLSAVFQCATSTDSWSACGFSSPQGLPWKHSGTGFCSIWLCGSFHWAPFLQKGRLLQPSARSCSTGSLLASSSCNTLASRTHEPATVPGYPWGFDSRHFSIQSFSKCPGGQISSKFCKNSTPAASQPFSELWTCLL